MSLGKEIKRIRKELNLTQVQLASDICAQTLISKIENDEIIPNSVILTKLGERLSADLISFKDKGMKATADKKIEEIRNMIDLSLSKRDYEMIELIVKSNAEIINDHKQKCYAFYFRWIKGLLFYYNEDNPDRAISEFNSLNTCELPPDFAVDVTCSIGIVHYEMNNLEKAKKYFEISKKWFSDSIAIKSKIKLLINYSLCLERLDNNEEALELVFHGIDISKKSNSIIGLADLYYHKGYILNKLNQSEEAVRSYKIAHSLFEIQENSKFSLMANLRIEEIENKEVKNIEKNLA
ncbi:helix-turn-helix domain-containing protein [Marinilactibacillus kalidii]|uniref:helix-turn-helix domain-containing protein n=1 Tax=Marinilactibacillus kalidii TaxID=2820274 RepID=UPI001ABDD49A|nr:helix-turn-helix domain-containing protein [Marinilactibacillus kalidii]